LARKLDGLAPLTDEDRAALEGLIGYVRPVERHSVLVGQDCVADHALIVFGGLACRYKRRVSGRRQILAYLIPGDLCDRGALHGYPLDHAIEALTGCRIAKVPRAAYLDLLSQYPRIVLALQRARLAEEATAREWMVRIGMRSGPERMAHLLCEMMERLGQIGQVTDGQFDLPLTQVDLADTLGQSSVHVNRVLQALRRDGLIALRGRRLQILAPRRLRQLAEFESGYL
jgi:CRP-like cAMP-binding protein